MEVEGIRFVLGFAERDRKICSVRRGRHPLTDEIFFRPMRNGFS
jgi:hypothetical protein